MLQREERTEPHQVPNLGKKRWRLLWALYWALDRQAWMSHQQFWKYVQKAIVHKFNKLYSIGELERMYLELQKNRLVCPFTLNGIGSFSRSGFHLISHVMRSECLSRRYLSPSQSPNVCKIIFVSA